MLLFSQALQVVIPKIVSRSAMLGAFRYDSHYYSYVLGFSRALLINGYAYQ